MQTIIETRGMYEDDNCQPDDTPEATGWADGGRDYGRTRISRETAKNINARRARNKAAAKSRRANRK